MIEDIELFFVLGHDDRKELEELMASGKSERDAIVEFVKSDPTRFVDCAAIGVYETGHQRQADPVENRTNERYCVECGSEIV